MDEVVRWKGKRGPIISRIVKLASAVRKYDEDVMEPDSGM
jgi:hypothetical protein